MKLRSIRNTIKARKVDMDGFIVDQPLPHPTVDRIDPFLLIHHADTVYEPGGNEKALGVGPHPHRGFSPVTLVFEGGVHHRDSRGNDSIVGAGGTQWMHSGRGIIHSERPPKELAEKGGKMEIIQFWVNVPRSEKMTDPEYIPLTDAETPRIPFEDKKSDVGIVAGNYGGISGPIKTKSEILVLRMSLNPGASMSMNVPEKFNLLIYNLNGSLSINKSDTIGDRTMAHFEQAGKQITLDARTACRAVLFAGEPINEKVVSYGPFVMNSDTEIWQAMRDYRMGKMGFLVEKFS